jgi:hypothetical protein
MTTELHDAVTATLHKEYVIEKWVKFPDCRTKTLRTAYELLLNHGYAGQEWVRRSRKFGNWARFGHPAVIENIKRFGDDYVLLLKAVSRLKPNA